MLFEHFFFYPVLINDLASKDYFFSGLASTISYLMAYWEYNWKKHDNILKKHDGIKGEERFLSPTQ